ncbi:hypothetical protein CIC12_21565 [Burkholderia sp. SG-MS1]|uniref:tautomerase family protein n=1 Tax=Paraburkholderia sp. SG-MS1 TaxID=2023741 RepID=UPI0014484DC3|nr:tautomerase family protein [Paraburkholderia sp. SG-MS1]NKJ49270.1 hypothetical protein [Paraburkholderia sp. SG-MS1]
MRLVRFDLLKGERAAYRQQGGNAAYEAMPDADVPLTDRFVIVSEHEADNFQFGKTCLGVERNGDPCAARGPVRSLQEPPTLRRANSHLTCSTCDPPMSVRYSSRRSTGSSAHTER